MGFAFVRTCIEINCVALERSILSRTQDTTDTTRTGD